MAEKNPYQTPKAELQGQSFDAAFDALQLFSAKGRLGRIRYLLFSCGLTVFGALLAVLVAVLIPFFGFYVALVIYILMIVIFVFFTIRRCHDFNVTAWLSLLLIVPFVPIIFYLIPGTRGENNYGPQPPPNSIAIIVTAFILLAIVLMAAFTTVSMMLAA